MKRVNSLKSIRAKRNQKLRRYFAKLQAHNPKWRYEELLQSAAEQFDLSPRTVRAILNKEGNYAD